MLTDHWTQKLVVLIPIRRVYWHRLSALFITNATGSSTSITSTELQISLLQYPPTFTMAKLLYVLIACITLSHGLQLKIVNPNGQILRCGRHLPELVNTLCSDAVIFPETYDEESSSSDSRERRDISTKLWRSKRQIANSCCQRSCSFAELRRYCYN